MNVAIPAEFEQFVQSMMSTGSYADPAHVVGEALRLLKKREQLRQDVNAGVEQLNRGDYTEYEENSFREFLQDIKARERERFAQKHSEK